MSHFLSGQLISLNEIDDNLFGRIQGLQMPVGTAFFLLPYVEGKGNLIKEYLKITQHRNESIQKHIGIVRN